MLETRARRSVEPKDLFDALDRLRGLEDLGGLPAGTTDAVTDLDSEEIQQALQRAIDENLG